MVPREMTVVKGGKRYSTRTARLIASDAYWDGRGTHRFGRNVFLYKTPKGAYFVLRQSMWGDELDSIEPLTLEEAVEMYEALPVHEVPFEEAFPNVVVEDA